MTAEETAKSLVEKFKPFARNDKQEYTEDWSSISIGEQTQLEQAKQCALICCDTIIAHIKETFIPNALAVMEKDDKDILFYQSVRGHIEKMGGDERESFKPKINGYGN